MEQTLGNNELYLALSLIVGFCVCWAAMFFALKGKNDVLKVLFDQGNLLRMIAVVFVVAAVAYLSMSRKLTPEASTLFSGIAGYVLGGISRSSSSGTIQKNQ
jgi:hypothetical protein